MDFLIDASHSKEALVAMLGLGTTLTIILSIVLSFAIYLLQDDNSTQWWFYALLGMTVASFVAVAIAFVILWILMQNIAYLMAAALYVWAAVYTIYKNT